VAANTKIGKFFPNVKILSTLATMIGAGVARWRTYFGMLYQEKSGNPDWGRVCHQNLNEKDPISCTKTYLEKMCGFGSFEKTATLVRNTFVLKNFL
jgi:hypothetical protein